MTDVLVAVDPGKHACGWAVFYDGHLYTCGLGEIPNMFRYPDDLVVEIPQIYQQRKWQGDPKALVEVAFAAGRSTAWHPEPHTIRPHDWKGSRPKDICNRVTMNALTDEEKDLIPTLPKTKLHNVIDAIGIGLWRLGRR